MYCVYGNSDRYIHGGPLFGGGPLLGGSVIGGSTVINTHAHRANIDGLGHETGPRWCWLLLPKRSRFSQIGHIIF